MNPLSQTGHECIGSDRIIGRRVFDHDSKFVGNISRLLVARRTGHVEQVIVQAPSYFGFGAVELKLPWAAFGYDITLPGYRLPTGLKGSTAKEG